jgi:hypothetical protein
MPNTKAPMTSDGPSGAIAPPKPPPNAATGTMTTAAMAISSSEAISPPASPRTRKRRHAAVKLNSVLRNATPSPKPATSRPAERGAPSISTSAIISAVASTATATNGQSVDGAVSVVAGACAPSVRTVLISGPLGRDQVPKPSAFLRSSQRVREDSIGRLAFAAHAAIEPS